MSELKVVPAGKLLTLTKFSAPAGNSKSSPATGATSPAQLVGLFQKVLVPPPSQVRKAAEAPGTMKKSTSKVPNRVRSQGQFKKRKKRGADSLVRSNLTLDRRTRRQGCPRFVRRDRPVKGFIEIMLWENHAVKLPARSSGIGEIILS